MSAQAKKKAANESTDIIPSDRKNALAQLTAKWGCTEAKLREIMMATVMPSAATPENFAAFVIVANQYDLNPLTKQIYAFESKGGGITPVVGIDGWITLVNRAPNYDGCDFEQDDESCTCTMFLKNRAHPVRVTEYMDECRRKTDPWNKHPKRMLRHKAYIQCARVAFGLSGIYDQDEAEEMRDVTPSDYSGPKAPDENPFDHRPAGVTTPAKTETEFKAKDVEQLRLEVGKGGPNPAADDIPY